MTREDWLLMFFALKGKPGGVDPVRIQKGMFLFAMESGVADDEKYEFRPYNYGPMSSEIYADVERLEAHGFIASEPVTGYSWMRYRVTPRGLDRAIELRDGLDDREPLRQLHAIKQDVTGQTFNELLRDVYARYPDYATRSVFSG